MTEAPEPKDKLDAATAVVVNGPEDATFDWHQIDWRRVEDDVRRLRQRIFTASKAGDLKKVRSLQKLTCPVPQRRGPGTSARLRAYRACLSRMLGNGLVRF
jgi:N-terminal domain of reverse transcriptase